MNLILCLDSKNGMLFNGRRLSRDIVVCQYCKTLVGNSKLWMNAYSKKMFAEYDAPAVAAENFLEIAGDDDFCFAETMLPELSDVKNIYVFRWNRHYPSDCRFCPEEAGFRKMRSEDMEGRTHPVITLEVYNR